MASVAGCACGRISILLELILRFYRTIVSGGGGAGIIWLCIVSNKFCLLQLLNGRKMARIVYIALYRW